MGAWKMNSIFEIDLIRKLPDSLKGSPKIRALASAIAMELQKVNAEIDKTIIYARIDELPEEILDVLAYDLHVDWYDYEHPVEAKRAVIKDSVRVHKYLGTKYAVVTALSSLHPNSAIEEWFEYNGDPYYFRAIIDVTHSRAQADYYTLTKAIEFYKSLRSHLEDIIYQCSINLGIDVDVKAFSFNTGLTGKIRAGEKPQRNIRGSIIEQDIGIDRELSTYLFTSDIAGTKPYINIRGKKENIDIDIFSDVAGAKYNSGLTGTYRAGTEPERNKLGSDQFKSVSPVVKVDSYSYNVKRCGTSITKQKR